jgi:hypothetical protein
MSENDKVNPTPEENVSSVLSPEEIKMFSPPEEEAREVGLSPNEPEETKVEAEEEAPKELTEEEKRANLIQAIKNSKIKFHPIKHAAVKTIAINAIARPFGGTRLVKERTIVTNVTTNQFGGDYRQKRKAKNRMQKKSRKNNR